MATVDPLVVVTLFFALALTFGRLPLIDATAELTTHAEIVVGVPLRLA